ncbi:MULTISPECIES: hypothetical protein [Sulfolobaceae]|uniref:hypothetical protein n=1 Tax=Sulfolobaceae TaxID=118883 RepID=UPI0015E8E604|nr:MULTISPECIES: hypothetical protein [unclassified Sulfolobus]
MSKLVVSQSRIRPSRLMLYISLTETILLAGLFYAGIATLFYDKFPLNAYSQALILSSHITLAMLVGFFGAAMLAQSVREGIRSVYLFSLLNLLFIGIAAAGGLVFYGLLTPDYAYLMALGFFGSLFCTSSVLFYAI